MRSGRPPYHAPPQAEGISGAYFADQLYNALFLGLSEPSFWRATPRKLAALVAAHNRFHAEKSEPKARKATAADFAGFGITPKG